MAEKPPEILIVDDEPQIIRVMRASLPPRGLHVRTASSGEEALREIGNRMPDLIVLDLVLPGMTGLDVCRIVRESSQVPIIVLSAKGSERDKVVALELGADDYLTKPFGMNEMIARIRAVLRRASSGEGESLLQAGCVTIDVAKREVRVRGEEVRLTPKEFEVLKHLVSNAGKVVEHRSLLKAVWGWQSAEQTEYVRVIVNQLRRKIERDPDHPKIIMTVPWVGYRAERVS
ncbi:MAG: response regulator transcription factor [Acidobacteria bacterium]|nr:response regulator transcription factor [Acidobacteriota bacterium]